jgi:hypothetical protein
LRAVHNERAPAICGLPQKHRRQDLKNDIEVGNGIASSLLQILNNPIKINLVGLKTHDFRSEFELGLYEDLLGFLPLFSDHTTAIRDDYFSICGR